MQMQRRWRPWSLCRATRQSNGHAVDGGDEERDLCKRIGVEAFIDFTTIKDITAEIMRITTYGTYGAHGVASNSCNEGRVCDGAEFLASGRDDGDSRIAEGSYGVGGRPRR
jgi:hypothetical protein